MVNKVAKDTEELLNDIQSAEDIDAYFEENEKHLLDLSFSEYLKLMLKQKSKTIVEVQRGGRLTNYIYELFSGDKMPTRNTALQLCFGFELKPDEAQRLLRMAKAGALYAKDRRDAVLLFALKERLNCAAANDLLEAKGMECLP